MEQVSAVLLWMHPLMGSGEIEIRHLDANAELVNARKIPLPPFGDDRAAGIRQAISEEVAAGHRRFILDLQTSRFVNSIGLGLIIQIYTSVTNAEGRFVIIGASHQVINTFRITSVDSVLTVRDSAQEALEFLAAEPV